MFWVNTKRVIKAGWINFRRNGLVSYAAIFVTTITLSVIMALFLFQAVLDSTIAGLQNQVDIAVYFTVDAPEDRILALQNTLQQMPEVAMVDYVSADQQVLDFRTRHSSDYLTLQALDELGNNPFGGALRIKAKDSTQYEAIANALEGNSAIAQQYSQIIDRINFAQNEDVINRLNLLIKNAHEIGLGITIALSLISITITFTTIRLTIYMAREEIGIMRLVGASGGYVRAPFIVEGILYGGFAWLLTMIVFLPATYFLGAHASNLLGIDLYQFYVSHIISTGSMVLLVGLFLGAVSSVLAVRRYLNV